jgi:arsenate reductase
MIAMFGIKNCDTIKKARRWMDENGLAYAFHDYKAEGIDAARLARWSEAVGWEPLLNKAGTTFRKLDDADKQGIDAAKAQALMLANPSMIKRPVVEHPGGLLVGFAPDRYARGLL